MRKVKQFNKWRIYENSAKEVKEYGFKYTVIHPDNCDCVGLTPADSDWECESLDEAIDWIQNY